MLPVAVVANDVTALVPPVAKERAFFHRWRLATANIKNRSTFSLISRKLPSARISAEALMVDASRSFVIFFYRPCAGPYADSFRHLYEPGPAI